MNCQKQWRGKKLYDVLKQNKIFTVKSNDDDNQWGNKNNTKLNTRQQQ